MRPLRILRTGPLEHSVVDSIMRELQAARIAEDIPDTLLFTEHPEIVTVGPKARRDNVVVPTDYEKLDVDRGGGITYHGPGQLVAYPIIHWTDSEQSVPGVIKCLEEWVIAALMDCGIESSRDNRMQGVWVDGKKVCSIGLSFLKWVSRHGLAINIETKPGRVETLDGCGLNAGLTTSLHSLGHTRDLEGRIIERKRIEEGLILTAQDALNRTPLNPLEWDP
ncbi:MAG TPA: lipoyl(octanoyl) transferase LipB [Candidatus Thalassarchaeaceae archaeon]|nr:lipoyl(octanoyl) transferase LipB [Candidatus Thalassarchaeaceae archaeon]